MSLYLGSWEAQTQNSNPPLVSIHNFVICPLHVTNDLICFLFTQYRSSITILLLYSSDFQSVHHRIFKTCNTWLFSQGHWPLFPQIVKLKKWQQPIQQHSTTQLSGGNESKLYLFFLNSAKKFFLVCYRILVISFCVP